MTCSKCSGQTDGQPVVVVCVEVDEAAGSRRRRRRFTGIVWHADCAPVEQDFLRSECNAVVRDAARAAR